MPAKTERAAIRQANGGSTLTRQLTMHLRTSFPVSTRFALLVLAFWQSLSAATFVVTNTADSGQGSLRQAIISANTLPGPDIIQLNIPGAGVQNISVASDLPAISDVLTIDGTTQPGYGGTPLIAVSGAPGSTSTGFALFPGKCALRALCINGFSSVGILAYGSNNVIEGCFVGTDPTGTQLRPNGIGILVGSGSSFDQIGGSSPGARNIISGNRDLGLYLFYSSGHNVQGNLIGTDVTGTLNLFNGSDGISVDHSFQNNIGGTRPGERNVISGNGGAGIQILGDIATGNVVEGNFIGIQANGQYALGNRLSGIIIHEAPANTIGGTEPGAGNVISGNGGDGVNIANPTATGNVLQGNLIGLNAAGNNFQPNYYNGISIVGAGENTVGGVDPGSRNIISGNRGYGVLLSASGNVVQGNFIGTDVTGTVRIGNGGGFDGGGIAITGDAQTVGGETPEARNIISGNNNNGILLESSARGSAIQGNWIGTGATGEPLGNTENGILIYFAVGNIIGGQTAAHGNVISANRSNGIQLNGFGASANEILNNTIGLGSDSHSVRGNVLAGVSIQNGASGNFIGEAPESGNVIAGNGTGIEIGGTSSYACSNNIIRGNRIGLDVDSNPRPNLWAGIDVSPFTLDSQIGGREPGEANIVAYNRTDGILLRDSTSGITISANSIFANGGLAINLQPSSEPDNTVTPNDSLDNDSGPNHLQNFPTITNVSYTSGLTFIGGLLRSTPDADFDIEVFANDPQRYVGFGDGQSYLGFVSVSTDSAGFAAFQFSLPENLTNQLFTATATDNTTAETSEVSAAFPKIVRIAKIERVKSNVAISFTADVGAQYALLWTASLPAVSWNEVSGAANVSGTGSIVTAVDTAPNAPRFYRVHQLP